MTPEQKALFDKLTPFLQALAPCVLRNMKQADAYRIAKPDSTNSDGAASAIVCKAIQRPDFVAYMDAMKASLVSDAIMTREEALERLSVLARGDLAKLVDFQTVQVGPVEQSVWKIKDSMLQDEKQMAAISELTASSQGIKIKLHQSVNAIQQLTVMQGWAKPVKVDHTSKDGSMTPKSALDVTKLSTSALLELMNASKSDK